MKRLMLINVSTAICNMQKIHLSKILGFILLVTHETIDYTHLIGVPTHLYVRVMRMDNV